MTRQEGLIPNGLRAAHTVGPLPQLVKAGAQAVHYQVIPGHVHELLHLTATHITRLSQLLLHHNLSPC